MRYRPRLRSFFSLAAAAGVLCFSLAAPTLGQAAELVPVTLRVDIFFYGADVPFMVGIVDGIYKKQGLDVTAMAGRGSATTIQTVANGSDDFGFADGGTLARLAAQGLKEKMVLGILQRNPMFVATMPDSGIKEPKQLEGKTGGFAPEGSTDQMFWALAAKTGINASAIKQISVDVPTRDTLFLTRKTDFDFGYTAAQLPLLEEKCNCKLNVFRYADYGIDSISNGVVVSDKLASEKPDLVKKFVSATAESIQAAMKDPDRGVDDFFKYVKNTQLSRNVVRQQWLETVKLLHTKATESKPIGVMDVDDWQKTISLLEEYAKLPKGAVKPDMVFTNAFLEH